MYKQTRLLALCLLQFLVLGLSAQTQKPLQGLVQTSREQGNSFSVVRLFHKTQAFDASAARFAQMAQFLTLDPSKLQHILAQRPQAITLALPYNGEEVLVDLVQVEITAPGFTVQLNTGEETPDAYATGLHYRGVVRGKQPSLAAVSFFDHEIMGIVSDETHNNLVLGRVQQSGNQTGYMLYSDLELAMDNPFECAVVEPQDKPTNNDGASASNEGGSVNIFLEAAYDVYRDRGSVQNTVNYLAGVFNQTAALYAGEGIQLYLSHLMVWASPDPYAPAGNAGILEQFRRVRNNFDGDLAHLVGLGNNVSESQAYWNTLCNPTNARAYSGIQLSFSHVPTYAWAVEVMAHELGHNLGARHTQWCGWPGGAIDLCQLMENGCGADRSTAETNNSGTVMNYCPVSSPSINFSRGFGPLPGNTIRTAVSHSPCLALTARTTAPRARTTANAVKNAALQVAPNPATRQVTIQLSLDAEKAVRIELLDLTGRPVRSQTATLKTGEVSLDLTGLAKGIYLVQVTDNGKPLMTKRLIKE